MLLNFHRYWTGVFTLQLASDSDIKHLHDGMRMNDTSVNIAG